MSDKQETVADIIAQKRAEAAAIRADLSCVAIRRDGQLAEADAIDEEADRLGAAHERELAAARREPRTWGECVAEYQKRKEAGEYGPY